MGPFAFEMITISGIVIVGSLITIVWLYRHHQKNQKLKEADR